MISFLHSFTRTLTWPVVLGILVATVLPTLSAQESRWSEADSRLANQYMQLLQKDPAYGKVLNLLWELYEKKGQLDLLRDYLKGASEKGSDIGKLIYAHVLRKSADLDSARALYAEILKKAPDNVSALKSQAEIADQQKLLSEATDLYTRLVKLIPPTAEDAPLIRRRLAELYRQSGQNDLAVAEWERLLQDYPADTNLRTQILGALMEAGAVGPAAKLLREQSQSENPAQRVEALQELSQMYEFSGDLPSASKATQEAMELVHFKSPKYAELFSRYVRIHERNGDLETLEASLKARVERSGSTSFSERDLFDLAEFYRLTADSLQEEATVAKLSERLPKDTGYRLRLVSLQMRNDHYQAAAATLDRLLEEEADPSLDLVLQRALIDLHTSGRLAASSRLEILLQKTNPDLQGRRSILDFARTHHLDDLVERLLADPILAADPSDGSASPVELAKFLSERGRTDSALAVLRDYTANTAGGNLEKASRLHQISEVLKDMGRSDEALHALDEAITLAPANIDYQLSRADLCVTRKEIDQAIAQFEKIREACETLDRRTEIDQKLFSLIRGYFATRSDAEPSDASVLKQGRIQSLAEYRRLAAAASRTKHSPGDEAPPLELIDYYDRIKTTAEDSPSIDHRYRAAWWAFKLQDFAECTRQLDLATQEAGKPVIEVEKLYLDLAEQNEIDTRLIPHLDRLIQIDPEHAEEYRRRRADVRFSLGFEDEAVKELEALAQAPDVSPATLNSLAKIYQRLGHPEKQVEIWQGAFRKADLFEKRIVVKQLSTALVEAGQPEDALRAQIDLIQADSDPVQRHKQLDSQIALAQANYLLDWMQDRYEELIGQHPLDPFFFEALARVCQAAGRDREAYDAMQKAYYMSGRNEALLADLSDLSARLGDLKSAIYYRRQLLSLGDSNSLANWKELVSMLEKDLRVAEADRLRVRLESKFSSDTDYLAELADYYVKASRPTDAERVLTNLASLRNWDLPVRFRLGLLQIQREDYETAFTTFDAILDDTDSLEYPKNYENARLPLILTPANRVLDAFVFTVEAYPALGDAKSEVAEALQASREEFEILPKSESAMRLRAIEEAAILAVKLGRESAWRKRWAPSDRPLIERLWAARYSQDRSSFATLLRQLPEAKTRAEELGLAYCHLLADEKLDILSWLHQEEPAQVTTFSRAVCLGIAALILRKDASDDPLSRGEWIDDLLGELPQSKEVAFHQFSELRKVRLFEAAWHLGRHFAEGELKEEGGFLYQLSQTAGLAGRAEEQRHWLDQSLRIAASGAGGRLMNYFYPAILDKLSSLESDSERDDFLESLRTQMNQAPFRESDRAECDLQIALARGNHVVACQALNHLLTIEARSAVPTPAAAQDESNHREGQAWQRMTRILQRYGDHLHPSPYLTSVLADSSSRLTLMRRAELEVSLQYESFETIRCLLLLRGMSPAERESKIRILRGLLREPDSLLDLAKSLESRGYYREAVTVYRDAAVRRERDYAPLQGLFDAAFEALDPKSALDVITLINNHDFPTPPGLTFDYLNEQHARFLLMNRDIERLTQLGRQPEVRDGAPPVTNRSYLPYQDALIEAYRRQGDDGALLRLLSEQRHRGTLSGEQSLLGAEALIREGRQAEAITWLQPLAVDPEEATLQRRAIQLSLGSHAAMKSHDVATVRALAQAAMGRQPSTLVRAAADALFQAGGQEDAISILHLLRRSSENRSHRTSASAQILRLKRQQGKEWSAMREDLENFFRDFQYEVNPEDDSEASDLKMGDHSRLLTRPNAYRFVKWAISQGDPKGELTQWIEQASLPSDSRWLADLLAAHFQGQLKKITRQMTSDLINSPTARFRLLETLPAFGDEGIAVAREIVSASHAAGTEFFPNEPARQIAFFHRIGDRYRLLEVHAQLMREAMSPSFQEPGNTTLQPNLDTRRNFPTLFASIEESELAGSLFDRYAASILPGQRQAARFREDHLAFLIEHGDYPKAEKLIRSLLNEPLRFDLRWIPRLYQAWGRLDEMEERLRDLSLTQGQEALLNEWSSALAEGRELREVRDSW